MKDNLQQEDDLLFKFGQDLSKMRHRAFILYSRDRAFAVKIFPEFEKEWEVHGVEWLKNDSPENDQYFSELVKIYNKGRSSS